MDPLYLYNYIITYSLEFIAAIAGSIYLKKSRDQSVRLFVNYLWFIFIVEVTGLYPWIFHLYDFDYLWFQWLKNSSFENNAWLYNIKSYVDIIVLGLYFKNLIETINYRKLINILIVLYCISATFYSFYVEEIELLEKTNYFIEEIVIVSIMVLYLLELFKSDKVLKFHHLIHFYVAFGWFVWYLCVMPIYIFGEFFKEVNTLYVNFRVLTILMFNIFLYSWFTFGFYYSLRKKKQLVKNR